MARSRERKHLRHPRQRESTGRPPAPDILPKPPRPLIDRAILEHEPSSTRCQHGVDLNEYCGKCDRRTITAAIDAQLRELKR